MRDFYTLFSIFAVSSCGVVFSGPVRTVLWQTVAVLCCVCMPLRGLAMGPRDCPWVMVDGSFRGAGLEQALCLMADPAAGEPVLAALPATLEELVGTPFTPGSVAVERYMLRAGVTAEDVGGPAVLRVSLSHGEPAAYFVLHGMAGEATVHEDVWPVHVVIRTDGSSRTLTDFFSPLGATRFETAVARGRARGRFLHVGLRGGAVTTAQYARLATIYMIASARAGRWLVPVFAGTLDAGLRGAAVSPDSFNLESWSAAVRHAYRQLYAGR